MTQRIYTDSGLVPLRTCLEECKGLFFVHGKHSYSSCGAEEALRPILQAVREVTEFTDFSTNPKDEEARIGAEQLVKSGSDCLLVVGGGSAMDTAKLIRHYAAQKDYQVRLIAIPTTAGTGAESTHFAVSYVDGVKTSVEGEDLLPDVVILHAPFTYANDTYLTACTGFDALAQAIEAYWNRNATAESDALALKALTYLHAQLPACIAAPTEPLRNSLAVGANLAGQAINITKTTAPHAFSYAFTSQCGYPHGHAVALTFPYFAELNMRNNPKEGKLRAVLNMSDNESWLEHFRKYVDRLGLTYHGIGNENLEDILNSVNLQRLKNNPVEVDAQKMQELKNYIESL